MAIWFSVWEDGKGTKWLSQRSIGDMIELLGPLGNGYSLQPTSQKLLLLAGGVGIAPLYFLIQEAQKKQCSVVLLHGASTANHIYPKDMPCGIESNILTEDGSRGQKGMVTNFLVEHVDWADQIFACGPMPMYRDMASERRQLKLTGKSVQVSLETRMGCGRGVCYSCTVKTKNGLKQVCRDGPVFELDDILWDELNY
jgi:dihydroorotate dehydrogenase electron transfer subunit